MEAPVTVATIFIDSTPSQMFVFYGCQFSRHRIQLQFVRHVSASPVRKLYVMLHRNMSRESKEFPFSITRNESTGKSNTYALKRLKVTYLKGSLILLGYRKGFSQSCISTKPCYVPRRNTNKTKSLKSLLFRERNMGSKERKEGHTFPAN
jgi:hypothetical protein